MKQVIQDYSNGKVILTEVPEPTCGPNVLIVKNYASLLSIGTERSLIELGKKSLLGKAKSRPDLVKRFFEKSSQEGFFKTFKEALDRLDTASPLGYSSAGIVVKVGSQIHSFSPGDRVACIGAGVACHAEYIRVPQRLCVKIPDSLSFEEASFGMLGIIALHAIRSAKISFGETVAIIGLGLLGLLIAQIARSYGCKIIGIDTDPSKVELAKKICGDHFYSSPDDLVKGVHQMNNGAGSDAVIISAATESDKPVHLAVEIVREHGRIVVVGVTDIHPHRNEMWHKEVEIIVSKAGGPGIFDPLYEQKGIDYPIGLVRWTEQRNLEEIMRLIAEKKMDVLSLISHRFSFKEAETVYKNIFEKSQKYIGIVFSYIDEKHKEVAIPNQVSFSTISPNSISVGVIGAGLFARSTFLSILKKIKDVSLHTIAANSGVNAIHTAKKFGFTHTCTNYKELVNNKDINTIIILASHNIHAEIALEAMKAGKHIFIEKPLCINKDELLRINEMYSEYTRSGHVFMVGYNRSFSPHICKLQEILNDRKEPLMMNYRVNAGFLKSNHWVHSEEEGGSRIIGEMCHFVQLFQYLTQKKPIQIYAQRLSGNNATVMNSDNISVIVKFNDGSIGTLVYTALGDRAYSREQLEVFSEGNTGVSYDYKKTKIWKNGKKKIFQTWNQELGYKEELEYFFGCIHGNRKFELSENAIFSPSQMTFAIIDSLNTGLPVSL